MQGNQYTVIYFSGTLTNQLFALAWKVAPTPSKEQGTVARNQLVWVEEEEDVDFCGRILKDLKDPAKQAILHMASKKDPAGRTFRLE